MLDSSKLKYSPFTDNRTKKNRNFIGGSGKLYLATDGDGRRYLVKHTYPHNAANEYTACWLAERLGVPAPKAWLLSPNRAFASPYAVAIEFIDGLTPFLKDSIPNQDDLISQLALSALIDTDHSIQLSQAGDRIVSYDFSEAFNMMDMSLLLKMLDFSKEAGTQMMIRMLDSFTSHLGRLDFDYSSLAEEFHIDSGVLQSGMIEIAKRVICISDEDLNRLSDELREMYPMEIAVYYEMCIRRMRERMAAFS